MSSTERSGGLVSLDDRAALDRGTVGGKAALLARARQLGFNVLPGLVVPIAASRQAVEVGLAALEERGMAAARSAVGAVAVDPALIDDLGRARELGSVFVVRSSSELDGNGAWSGAFASFGGVAPAELAIAVRACWASLLAPNVVRRSAEAPTTAARHGIAVLIQPQLLAKAGGWARITGARIEVAAVRGAPGPLLQGWERGARYIVRDGAVDSDPDPGPLSAADVMELAEIALRAQSQLGVDHLEWAAADDGFVIFQLDPPTARSPAPDCLSGPGSFATAPFQRLARILAGRSGPLADRLLVPWAAAAPDRWAPIVDAGAPPVELLRQAHAMARALNDQVAEAAGLTSGTLDDRLTAGDGLVSERLAGTVAGAEAVGRILGAVEAIAAQLMARGLIEDSAQIWWQSADWVAEALASSPRRAAARRLGDRWADLIFAVTASVGADFQGLPASAGRATGPAVFVDEAEAAGPAALRTGQVMVVERPLIVFAPLLWKAAALVSRTGSPAAHLCEVARSLRVPAVVSAPVQPAAGGTILAVDGERGIVWDWRVPA